MEIGILDCDRVDPKLASEYGQYADMFIRGLSELSDGLRFQVFDAMASELPAPDSLSAWIITGSRHSAYEELPWIAQLKDWIQQAQKHPTRIAGICFGHQVIAEALGGRVAKHPGGWGMGSYPTRRTGAPDYLADSDPELYLLSSHQDQVVQLPPGAQLLATSAFCPHYSFGLDDRVLTVQGHPEFLVGYNRALADKRREQIGEAVYEQALASFERPPQSQRFLQGMLRFFAS
ncbi:glutamine amidotransferase-related protein [Ferrimonas marina]|uniref:GMP synthase-Glutamine amidotransferase n=1 Tax=Ferrimonas marina TaxID=299255 RepID=A0A1M5ZHY0_9GAMM|nr:glutamine amidotransferase [Ferrimonas marina]SHI23840.1 GMP synthase-Glutamine amidotransferase [Ferrimonas marina]